MAAFSPPAAALFYGNQAYSVDQAAQKLTDRVLGDGPRDFSFQRFDAAELLKGSGEGPEDAAGTIQEACEAAPFLCERWVVRIDHGEMIRGSDRAVQTLRKALDALLLLRCRVGEVSAWALEDDLTPDDPREGGAQPQPWVHDVEARSDGPPVLHLREGASEARCLLTHRDQRRLADVKTFLREKLKGRFLFADELETQDATPGGAASASARLLQVLERVLASPPEGLCLILTARATRETDLARPLLAALKGKGPIEKFVTYDDYNPLDFVMQGARERGVRLSRPQAERVIQLAGNDLGRLAGELDKLALLFDDGRPPDEGALVRALAGSGTGSLFLITEKLAARDLPGSLDVLEHFLAETPGEHPVLIGILARHVRQMLHVHALLRLQVPDSDWPSQLKLHPFIARKVATQARQFREAELEGMLRALGALDVAAKRHGHLTGPLFREFVQAACTGGFAHPQRSLGLRLLELA